MSSPRHSTFHPGKVDCNIAKFVLPQALGKHPKKYFFTPLGFVTPIISMCSANQPSSFATAVAILCVCMYVCMYVCVFFFCV